MAKIKTSELEGAALDWAVGSSLGMELRVSGYPDGEGGTEFTFAAKIPGGYKTYTPSTDWNQGGPLIEEYLATATNGSWGGAAINASWVVTVIWKGAMTECGPTFLVAACRAIVAAKLGDEVDVPEELL